MSKLTRVSWVLLVALGCGSAPHPHPKTSNAATDVSGQPEADGGQALAVEQKVVPAESDDGSQAKPRQMGRVAVRSDPEKHGEALRFRFVVNGNPISGVFQAPGGRSSTFAIPSGTVAFTVDECEWEEQGFPLAAGEEMALECKLSSEGDCCGVALPEVEEPEPKKQAHQGKPIPSE